MNNKSESISGFTLVELAIVMTIIGLLIGGVLKGQQLMQNARVTSTIAQVRSYQAAIPTFMDTYAGLPGDTPLAAARIIGCTAANFCLPGNGNSMIDTTSGNSPNWNTLVVSYPETAQFWKQLAMANMISGVVPSANPDTPIAGETHPSSRFGGGFEFYYDRTIVTALPGAAPQSAHLLRLSKGGIAGTSIGVAGQSAVTPTMAAQIDRKMDDGHPLKGSVMANHGGGANACRDATRYMELNSGENCDMYFLFY